MERSGETFQRLGRRVNASNFLTQLLFGSVGFVALVYGKKQAQWKTMALGAVLMGCPYLIPNTLALFLIGVVLTAALFVFKD